jgi:hypothetical protein
VACGLGARGGGRGGVHENGVDSWEGSTREGGGSLSLSLRKGGGPTDGTPHIPWKCGWLTWGGGGGEKL